MPKSQEVKEKSIDYNAEYQKRQKMREEDVIAKLKIFSRVKSDF